MTKVVSADTSTKAIIPTLLPVTEWRGLSVPLPRFQAASLIDICYARNFGYNPETAVAFIYNTVLK